MVTKVLLAEPRGFCAGVEKAIKALAWMVKVFEPPVYCFHEIVHNQVVVERFVNQGVVFVDSIDAVPDGAVVMLSAHGSAPEVIESASAKHRISVNAVCPLVTKVHHEVKVRSNKGYRIIYVGHVGHDEAVGTVAVAPESVSLIETEADLDSLELITDAEVALLSQTTLSMDEWAGIRERASAKYPNLWMPNRSDLCFATTNRQGALKDIAHLADSIVVIGSANSSNTVALEKVALAAGCPKVYRVNSADELPENLHGLVGVTAGASAPDELVEQVVAKLAPKEGVQRVCHVDEDEYFPPPPELRDLMKTVTDLVAISFGVERTGKNVLEDDRAISASTVLARLSEGE